MKHRILQWLMNYLGSFSKRRSRLTMPPKAEARSFAFLVTRLHVLAHRHSKGLRLSQCLASLLSQITLLQGATAQTLDSFNPGWNGSVSAIVTQPDRKIIMGGNGFVAQGGVTRSNIVRFNADGSLDASFNSEVDYYVSTLAIQPDGQILVGGGFSTLNRQNRRGLGRLNETGALDPSFSPEAVANSDVRTIALQPDGKILVGGSFTTLGGLNRAHIGRLHPDGRVDTTFDPSADDVVSTIVMQNDDRILVGGDFSYLGRKPFHWGIGRLNPDGSLDTMFTATASGGDVRAITLQPDGKILVAGSFSLLNSKARNGIGRINVDGTIDDSFVPSLAFNGYPRYVESLALQADGNILITGNFASLDGLVQPVLGRLSNDGTVDTSFLHDLRGKSGFLPSVNTVLIQADGTILIGGDFRYFSNLPVEGAARLKNATAAIQDLSREPDKVVWLRSGATPEVWRTTFEQSTNGVSWEPLGSGSRIQGGWLLTNTHVSPVGIIRARGFVAGDNNSRCFVEGYVGVPGVIAQPVSKTNAALETTSCFFDVFSGMDRVW